MSYRQPLILSFLYLAGLAGYSQKIANAKSDTSDVKNTLKTNTKDSTIDISSYSGVYVWDDFIQMYPYTIDSNNAYHSLGNKNMNDINAEFMVQDMALDQSTGDTDVIIKYLYYLKDKRPFIHTPSNDSYISNNVFFFRYNYAGTDAMFDSLKKEQIIGRDFNGQQRYFEVNIKIFRAHAVKAPKKLITKGGFGFGVVNYPFKWRGQKGAKDFSGSFNVGAAVAYTYKHDSLSKWRFVHVLGFGISSISLDKSSVDRGGDTLSATNSFSALTLSYGFMVQYDKVQIGVFMGVDQISRLNNMTYGWKYQGNPWFSVGLGYSIFSTSTSSQQSKTDTQP